MSEELKCPRCEQTGFLYRHIKDPVKLYCSYCALESQDLVPLHSQPEESASEQNLNAELNILGHRGEPEAPASFDYGEFRYKIRCANLQFRHNNDNSESLYKPEKGFVAAYDIETVEKLLDEYYYTAGQQSGLEGVLENMRGISMHWDEKSCILTTTGKTFRHDFKIRKPTYQEAIRTLLEEIKEQVYLDSERCRR